MVKATKIPNNFANNPLLSPGSRPKARHLDGKKISADLLISSKHAEDIVGEGKSLWNEMDPERNSGAE